MDQNLDRDMIRGPLLGAIQSLEYHEELLFAGSGNQVYIYNLSNQLVHTSQVFQYGTIHRIRLYKDSYVVFISDKVVAIAQYVVVRDRVELKVENYVDQLDWIYDAILFEDEHQVLCLAMGTAQNIVSIRHYKEPKEVLMEKRCKVKCILYNLSFYYGHGGLMVAAGTAFQQVLIWTVFKDTLQELDNHDGVIYHMEWSEDGNGLVSVSDDRSVQWWERNQDGVFESRHKMFGHKARVWRARFYKDMVISTSEDATCKMWSNAGKCIATLAGSYGKNTWCVAVHPRLPILAAGGGDASIKIWDIVEQMHVNKVGNGTFQLIGDVMNQVAMNKSKQLAVRCMVFVQGQVDGYAMSNFGHLWKLNVDVKLNVVKHTRMYDMEKCLENTTFCTMALNGAGTCMVGADTNGMVYVVDVQRCSLKYKFKSHHGRVLFIHTQNIDEDFIVFTSSIDGLMKEWILTNTEALIQNSYQLSTKYSVASLLISQDLLFCGDGRGNLMIFHHDRTLSTDVRQAACVKHKAHNRDIHTLIERDGVLYSGGDDGYICRYEIHRSDSNVSIHIASRLAPPCISSIKQMYYVGNDLYIFGFHGASAILYNSTQQIRVFDYACGGKKRPHAFAMNSENLSHYLVFASAPSKDQAMHSAPLECRSYSRKQSASDNILTRSIHGLVHDKLTACVGWLDDFHFISGSETNFLQVHRTEYIHHLPKIVSMECMHLAGIRALDIFHDTISMRTLVATAGSRNTVNIWTWNGQFLNHIHAHIPSDALQEQRISAITIVPHDEDHYHVVFGNSEGILQMLQVDRHDLSCNLVQATFTEVPSKPVLCMQHVRFANAIILIVGFTNGTVALWNISNPSSPSSIHTYAAHQMGANALSVHSFENTILIVSGGDDQAITIARIQFDSTNGALLHASFLRHDEMATSSLKAIYTNGYIVMTTGYDQRLCVYRIDSNALHYITGSVLSVSDIAAMAVFDGNIVVAGQGIQRLEYR